MNLCCYYNKFVSKKSRCNNVQGEIERKNQLTGDLFLIIKGE